MCCEAYNTEYSEEDRDKAQKCSECGGAVDENGDTIEQCCGYSPSACNTCNWKPCDGSC